MSWETWSFAFSVTVPNLLMMLLGILLRHWRLLDDRFIDGATKLVFNLALPCLLFFSIATNHPQLRDNFALVIYGAVGTIVTFLLLEIAAKWLVKEPRERGVFVQGGFRANTAIVGLAYAMTAYGDEGVAIASLYLTVTVILFNVLSVITLTRSLQGATGRRSNICHCCAVS
ncbi:auxin efflux carrier [Serratia fonticola]|uniref:Auxin efflux carrier n=1 Tax=Serratia fonticola TaxID=47917 RepID=A0A4V6KWE2_SERFO|nr:auxin efflux carrier [Serratia fonticola]